MNISKTMQCSGFLELEEGQLESILNGQPIEEVYNVEQAPFARGKFAAVRKCTHRTTGVEYAAKFIRKRRRMQDHRQDILHEVAVLLSASTSPRIVTLHEVFETPVEMVLVLELAAGGELQRLVDIHEGLSEGYSIQILRQVLLGLSFLHDRNIAHLDIKPQNILLTSSDDVISDVKLCDFGISRVIQEGIEVREILGTPDYVAPEILSFEPISLSTDIWSIGVLAYVLLTGCSPFTGDTKQETFCNISQCNLTFPEELFDGVSEAATDFIAQCLVPRPSGRLTVSECLAHPWLSSMFTSHPDSLPQTTGCRHMPFSCRSCLQCQLCHDDDNPVTGSPKPSTIELHYSPKVDFMLDRSIIC